MAVMVTRREGCNVRVSWRKPETGGLSILYYKIEI
jgi:hypothetical protein